MARGVDGAEDASRARQWCRSGKDVISVAALAVGVLSVHGWPEVGVVGDVKELRAELDVYPLREPGIFQNRKVEIPETGTATDVSSSGAIETSHRWLEGRCVKPPRRIAEGPAALARRKVRPIGEENRSRSNSLFSAKKQFSFGAESSTRITADIRT